MNEENGNGERRAFGLEIPVPWSGQTLKIRGMGVLLVLIIALNTTVAWALWEHKGDQQQSDITVAKALLAMTISQRTLACTIRKPPDARDTSNAIAACNQEAWQGLFVPELAATIAKKEKHE